MTISHTAYLGLPASIRIYSQVNPTKISKILDTSNSCSYERPYLLLYASRCSSICVNSGSCTLSVRCLQIIRRFFDVCAIHCNFAQENGSYSSRSFSLPQMSVQKKESHVWQRSGMSKAKCCKKWQLRGALKRYCRQIHITFQPL